MKPPEPTIDGTPISEIIHHGTDAYEYIDKPSAAYVSRLKRWTVFVGYDPYKPNDSWTGPQQYHSIEEIDVNAIDETEARIIGELALSWHYEEGGTIMHVEERFGMYF